MSKRRASSEPGDVLPAAASVTDLAARCRLSRSRFYALVVAGVFPPPTRTPGRRPHYPTDLIRQCLDIRRTGVGANGTVVLFNTRTPTRASRRPAS